MKEFLRNNILLITIFAVALFLRIINLENIPNSLHIDELYAGYIGERLIKTGRDIFGNYFPLYINMIGDFRPAGIFYITGLNTLLFGLNNFAIRFPVALIGSLTVVPLYGITRIITKNKKIGLLAAALLAISPWDIVASRATSESLISMILVLGGIYLLLFGLQKNSGKIILSSCIPFVFSYFFYHSVRLFVPAFLFLFLFIFFFLSDISKKEKELGKYIIGLFVVIVIFTAGISFTSFGIGRFSQVSLLSSHDLQQKRIALQDGDQGNVLFARIFFNKPVFYGKQLLDQYFSYFSPEYLFVHGGLPDRYVVDEMGLLYYIELPLLLMGLFYVFQRKDQYFSVPLLILLCGPLAASLTLEDSPNVQRSILMLPGLIFFVAYGLYYFIFSIRKNYRSITVTSIVLLFLLNFAYFSHEYFIHVSSHASFSRNDGNQQLFTYLFDHENQYNSIYLPSSEALPVYYLYFKNNTATNFSLSQQKEYNASFTFNRYHFIPYDCPSDFLVRNMPKDKKILIVNMPRCINTNFLGKFMTKIIRRDNTEAYFLSGLSQ